MHGPVYPALPDRDLDFEIGRRVTGISVRSVRRLRFSSASRLLKKCSIPSCQWKARSLVNPQQRTDDASCFGAKPPIRSSV
ncbi:hypothetical protein KM043_015027 [Ampulex compressa]|nr:hypothetical protein KM043_015027 [Ampulex compressa]